MKQKQTSLKAVDFFCGAGGLTRGLLDAHIDVVLGIDAEESCEKTYVRNNRPAQFLCADMKTLNTSALKPYIKGISRKQLVFVACAPCQPFAVLNKSKRKGQDAFLLSKIGDFVQAYRPKYIFIENVPGIARVKGASTLARFKRLLHELGYKFDEGTVNAKHYGVPQTRRRYLLLAAHKKKIILPPITHDGKKKKFQTVKDAISHLPRLQAGKVHSKVKNHVAARINDVNLERLRATPIDGGDRRSWPDRLVLKCHSGKHDGHSDVYGRMAWDKPAPTLTCKCNSISNGRYGHPTQARAISLREAAALQSFSDSYVFYGKHYSRIAAKIGNAVPVRLAKAVGEHLVSQIDKKSHGVLRAISSATRRAKQNLSNATGPQK
jgi:DNA (cytosine-5)-methyltransferase 1